MWTQIIKKVKQQQRNNNNDNDYYSDYDDDYDDGNNNDEDDESIYSPSSSTTIVSNDPTKKKPRDKNKGKNKKKKKPKDAIKNKGKKKTTGKEEIEENEQMEDEEITLEKVQKHCNKMMSKKRNGPKMKRFGNGARFYVHYPSFQDKDLASNIEDLLTKVQRVQPYDATQGAKKFTEHPATRTPKYMVIDQELTFEQLEKICRDYEW